MTKNNKLTTRQYVYMALLIAVNVAIARVFLIPVPMTHGNINLCDAGIFIAAFLFGRKQGAIVGGLSGFLLDLISGYAQYMVFSFIVHGLEGFVAGWLSEKFGMKGRITGLAIGTVIMVAGYLFTDTFLYHSWATGIAGVIPNLIQGLVGGAVAFIIYLPLRNRVEKLSHS